MLYVVDMLYAVDMLFAVDMLYAVYAACGRPSASFPMYGVWCL